MGSPNSCNTRSDSVIKLVLLRHGQSVWNLENRYTGWTDVELAEQGILDAKTAARLLTDAGFTFDLCYTSYLKRAVRTLSVVLDQMCLTSVPVLQSWQLNERHYGALQGLNKLEVLLEYGNELTALYRSSLEVSPPELSVEDPRFPGNDHQYANLREDQLPLAESLDCAINRAKEYWLTAIAPQIRAGKRVLVVAHRNSLRALRMSLEGKGNDDIEFDIPNGVPLVYELEHDLKPIARYYLSD